jgi:parallel beta-helix repeat protein
MKLVVQASQTDTKSISPKPAVRIVLRGGRYELTEPLLIDQSDLLPLTIEAYPKEKPVLSGGTKLSNNWKVETINGRTVWSQVLPEVAKGEWYFRQLWVNGRRATVPVIPKNSGFLQMKDLLIPEADRSKPTAWKYSSKDGFIFNPGDFKSHWHALEDVYVISSTSWLHNYFTIKEIDESTQTIRFNENNATFPLFAAHPVHGKFGGEDRTVAYDSKTFYEPGHYRIYNVFEALSEPGEFYLDRVSGKLSYIPRAGEKPESAEVVAPRLKQLLVVKGTPGKWIQNLVLDGIAFSHTEVTPEKHVGTGNQYNQPAVVQLDAVSLSTIKNCEFSHLGETALRMVNGSRDIEVVGNNFFDLGSGAIATYGAFGTKPGSEQINPGTTMRLRITDNKVTNGGRLFPGHPAVILNKTRNSIVAYNEISDFFFNGIAVLPGGDFDFSAVDNQVLNNHVHHLGQGHWSGNDMGALYTSSVGLGIEFVGNVLHDINSSMYGGSGIYLDDGANNFKLRNNLIYNTNYDGLHIKGFANLAENNIVYNCESAFGQVSNIKHDVPVEIPVITLKQNIFVPATPVVYNSRLVKPLNLDILSENNLVSTIEKGAEVQVAQRGAYGVLFANKMSFDSWQKEAHKDKGSVVAPVTFLNPEKGDFRMDKVTLEKAKSLGFVPFEINAGPRPVGKRTLIPFKPDNEAINSEAFKQYVKWVLPKWEKQQAEAERVKKDKEYAEKKLEEQKQGILNHVQ